MSDINVGGRPTKLTEQMLVDAQAYIDDCKDVVEHFEGESGKHWETVRVKLPTIEGLARKLRIGRRTVYLWIEPIAEDEQITDEIRSLRTRFMHTIEDLEAEQADRLVNCGLSGEYNSTIAKLILSGKHAYIEKTKTDITTDDKPLPIALVRFIGDEGNADDKPAQNG